ncbi:MAG TPA: IclR family transcriptional regulator [Firmicutes bacterium]|jgi:IclR family KDG regulon transcriptional repressor|nr:IclR family transcriptional regulator [Bacillota bacterium]
MIEKDDGVKSTPPVSSLAKALNVLECFTSSEPELGISEISAMLGLPKSSVHNILNTFALKGYVEQDKTTRRYRLGLAFLQRAAIVREGLGLRKVALPFMHKAKELYNETVHLAIEQDGLVMYLETVQPADRSVARIAVGKRAHMHCTGVGKAILAFFPDEKVKAIIEEHGLVRYTDRTITTFEELDKELKQIRLQGFAVDNMEHELGIRCIAVPLRDEYGKVTASISVSGPAERMPLDTIHSHAEPLKMLGLDISRRLGWQGY